MKNSKMTSAQLANVVTEFVRLIKANAMGGEIVAEFAVDKLRKGTAKNRSLAYTKFYDADKGEWRTTKTTHYRNITFQRSYANACNNRSENEQPYEVEAPNGKHWVEGAEGILLQANADPTKFYLRISENKNTKRDTTYYVDGNLATEEDIAIIKEFSPTPSTICKKQLEHGISEDNQVIVKDITLSNIVSIKFGEKMLNLR